MIVGLFTLLVLVGGVIAVIWMAGIKLDEDVALYDIYFEGNVTGLNPGNQVRYRGIPFGVVAAMRIDPENVERVKVTIEVPRKPPIKADAMASLEYQGITGVAFVQISGGTQEAEVLRRKPGEDNPVIASRPSQIDVVMQKAPELVTRFIALVDRANLLLSPANQEKFAQILGNVEGITGNLANSGEDIRVMLRDGARTLEDVRAAASEARAAMTQMRGSTDRISGDAEAAIKDARKMVAEMREMVALLGGDARGTLSEMKGLTRDLRISTLEFAGGMSAALKSVEREMDGVGSEARAAIRNVNKSAGHVGDAAEQLAGFMRDNREPVQDFTSSGLYELTQLLSETRVLVGALSRISSQIEQNPARFLFGKNQGGVEVK